MKKKLLLVMVLFTSFFTYSQITYEEGYFITNDGKKTKAYILNAGWKTNPREFQYKNSLESDPQAHNISDVAEFGISGKAKYVRKTINLDRSSDKIDKLGFSGNPDFSKETVFLRTLIEGEASLYSYLEDELKRYFFSMENSPVQPLVYKRYSPHSTHNGNPDILSNNHYRQQLWNSLKCESISRKEIENLSYTQAALEKIIRSYNKCKGEAVAISDYSNAEERDAFNLSIRPGVTFASLEASILPQMLNSRVDYDFGNKAGYRMGLELEYILPFNKNKWAVLVEPTYQTYNSETVHNENPVEASYQSIELPLGLRHYLFINNTSKFFLNGSAVIDFEVGDSRISSREIETGSFTNFALGAGFNYNNKLSLELRYNFNRAVLSRSPGWVSEYKSLAVILGYNLF